MMQSMKKESPTQSRFAFAREERCTPTLVCQDENSPAAANNPVVADHLIKPQRFSGVVSRLVGQAPSPKYGFITSDSGENIFFHFKTLPVDVMAVIERGSAVEFERQPNPFSDNKPMAVNLSVKGNDNKYRDSQGVLFRWIPEKEFGFIQTPDGTTYFAHKNSFVTKSTVGNGSITDEQSHTEIGSVQELKEGMQVTFDKSLNYKT